MIALTDDDVTSEHVWLTDDDDSDVMPFMGDQLEPSPACINGIFFNDFIPIRIH